MKTTTKIGDVFTRYTVAESAGRNKHGQPLWTVLCECGTIRVVRDGDLRSGHSKSCGCLKRDVIRELGRRHGKIINPGDESGRLTAVESAGRNKWGHALWLCRCDCGVLITITSGDFGVTKSCGCLRREHCAALLTTHGMSRTKEYDAWQDMLQRCLNPNNSRYADWGGRGIRVCERWLKFENFYADMGPCPPGMSLHRIDNDGNYEPGNCKWADRFEQASNARRGGFRFRRIPVVANVMAALAAERREA